MYRRCVGYHTQLMMQEKYIYTYKNTHNQRDAYTVCKTLKTMNEIINNIKQINIQKKLLITIRKRKIILNAKK